ncbi:hypothetical protein CAPTEDRAFT_190615 [Capitella teleta]|uniref:Death domain-containing protein n=1 Tax=Capitella teleta TaxID=283909 RepID=R7UAD9_CAPTE|nr:hypothetical protein CAPTEDRAFT_190615 [Capitella teleta]|eukprot:ELU00783.1 hypothetical protein CAPTEDRAFT_190615 [Capitella teleta]
MTSTKRHHKCRMGPSKSPCLDACDDDFILNRRLDMLSLATNEFDLVIFGVISTMCVYMVKRPSAPRESHRRTENGMGPATTLRSVPFAERLSCSCMCKLINLLAAFLCFIAYHLHYRIGNHRLDAVINHYKKNGLVPRTKKSGGANNGKKLSFEDTSKIRNFLRNYASTKALTLPGRIPGFKRSDILLLPSSHTKTHVYQAYKTVAEVIVLCVSATTFQKIWNSLKPNIRTCRPMTDLCFTCQSNMTFIFKSANLGEEEKGARLKQQENDPSQVHEERRALYQAKSQDAKLACQREGISGFERSAPCSRRMSMHYSFDYAQQVHLPRNPLQPGPIYFLVPRKCGLNECFGLVKQAFKRHVVSTLDCMASVVDRSTSCNQARLVGTGDGRTIVPVRQWQKHFDKVARPLSGIKSQQHYRFDSKHPGTVFYRHRLSDPESSFQLFPNLNKLPRCPSLGLSYQRKEYLFRQIRQFIVDPDEAGSVDIMGPDPERKPNSDIMSKTALQFYRKTQGFTEIIKERPTSILTVRQALLKATHETEVRLDDMERSFYGGQREQSNIQDMAEHCRILMSIFKISNWNAADQTVSMWSRVVDPSSSVDYDDIMNSIRELHSFDLKLKEFIPGKFEVIMEDVDIIVRHIKKYLLSFYDGGDAPYLETCYHYEQKKKEFDEAIQNHMQNILDMGTAYRSKTGLLSKFFGLHVNEIARARDCGRLLILLMFPQAMQNARNSLKALLKWLRTDEEYVEFLTGDLKSLETIKEEEMLRLNSLKEFCWTLEHRIQNVHKDAMQVKLEIGKLSHHEQKLTATVNDFTQQIRWMEMDIEVKENERDQLVERMKCGDYGWGDEEALQEKIDDSIHLISNMRFEIPTIRKKIDSVKSKMALMIRKRKLWDEKKANVKDMQGELTNVRGQVVLAEVEMQRIERAINTIRDVLVKKCSGDLPKKIFHQMPIKVRNARKTSKTRKSMESSNSPRIKGNYSIDDDIRLYYGLLTIDGSNSLKLCDSLDRACSLVAQLIVHDWPRLYRCLPFYPARGQANMDTDVSNLVQLNYRANDIVRAKESLLLWRRQHTLASIPELKRALMGINRGDIVEQLNRVKSPPKRDKAESQKTERREKRRITKSVVPQLPSSGRMMVADQSVRAIAAAAADAQKRMDELVLPKILT